MKIFFTRTQLLMCLLVALLLFTGGDRELKASALANPPTIVYGWSFTVAGTPIAAGADSIIDFTAARTSQVQVNGNQSSGTSAQPQTSIQPGPTKSVLLINDNASGGANIVAQLNSISGHATGGVPSDGVAGSTVIILFPGDKINIDGQFTGVGLQSSTGNSAGRVIASY
jgi:hypothetical protein